MPDYTPPLGVPAMRTALAKMDGFAESLRLLVEFEQYSLTDIGMMFGVTSERIRQFCVRYGIPTPPRGPVSGERAVVQRVWDDEQNRFVPVRRECRMVSVLESLYRRDTRALVRDGYRRHLADAGRSCAARLGRAITAAEWWKEASGRDAYAALASNAILPLIKPLTLRQFADAESIPLAKRGAPKLPLDTPPPQV